MEIYVFVAKEKLKTALENKVKKIRKGSVFYHVLNVISTFNFAGCGLVTQESDLEASAPAHTF